MAGTVHHGHAVGGRAEAAVAAVDAVARQQIGILAGTLAAGQLQQAVHVGRGLGREAQHFLPFPPLVRQGPQDVGIGREADAEAVLPPFFLELLRAVGCDIIQGYLFGKPLSQEEIEQLLQKMY